LRLSIGIGGTFDDGSLECSLEVIVGDVMPVIVFDERGPKLLTKPAESCQCAVDKGGEIRSCLMFAAREEVLVKRCSSAIAHYMHSRQHVSIPVSPVAMCSTERSR
jgi:hypothetical protein